MANEQRIIKLIKARATAARPGVTYREISQSIRLSKKQIFELLDSMQHAGVIFQQNYKPERGPETNTFCLRKDCYAALVATPDKMEEDEKPVDKPSTGFLHVFFRIALWDTSNGNGLL
jgi:predicted transcriptional regulator